MRCEDCKQKIGYRDNAKEKKEEPVENKPPKKKAKWQNPYRLICWAAGLYLFFLPVTIAIHNWLWDVYSQPIAIVAIIYTIALGIASPVAIGLLNDRTGTQDSILGAWDRKNGL